MNWILKQKSKSKEWIWNLLYNSVQVLNFQPFLWLTMLIFILSWNIFLFPCFLKILYDLYRKGILSRITQTILILCLKSFTFCVQSIWLFLNSRQTHIKELCFFFRILRLLLNEFCNDWVRHETPLNVI